MIPILFGQLCSFQGPTEARARGDSAGAVSELVTDTARAGLSKLNSVCARRGTQKRLEHARFVLGSVDIPKDRRRYQATSGALEKELPRKEVIQPHLPVRLPCYDFTPITSPTFDGSLPYGLGHRLRVLPAFVV